MFQRNEEAIARIRRGEMGYCLRNHDSSDLEGVVKAAFAAS